MSAPAGRAGGPPVGSLGALERRVMDAHWTQGPATARQLQDALLDESSPATTTVLTVLARLHGKALVTRTREGRAHRYHASISREDYLAALMHHTLTAAPNRGALLTRFLDTIAPEEQNILRELLQCQVASSSTRFSPHLAPTDPE